MRIGGWSPQRTRTCRSHRLMRDLENHPHRGRLGATPPRCPEWGMSSTLAPSCTSSALAARAETRDRQTGRGRQCMERENSASRGARRAPDSSPAPWRSPGSRCCWAGWCRAAPGGPASRWQRSSGCPFVLGSVDTGGWRGRAPKAGRALNRGQVRGGRSSGFRKFAPLAGQPDSPAQGRGYRRFTSSLTKSEELIHTATPRLIFTIQMDF
jgi:hypothetical protein